MKMADHIIRILLVEDDEVDIMNVQRAFRKNNIANPLVVANNGEEALFILREAIARRNDAFKIVILDLNMPKMGGIEFLRQVRADPVLKPLSVFVMTTSNEESDKMAAYDLNIAGYIVKPLSFDNFVHAISVLKHYWQLCERP
jgi:CheY-like chemotaxis protein